MRSKFIRKCLISFGLFLFLTVLMPFISSDAKPVKALAIEEGKSENYWLNVKSISLVKGKSFTLKAYNIGENAKVTYKSDDQEIASVSETGVITASKVGTTVITATINGDTDLKCEVLVGPPAFSVKITKSRIIIGLNNSDYSLEVILKPSNTVEKARFSSYDSSIVSVSTGGRINPKKIGLTYVFAGIEARDINDVPRYDTSIVIVTAPEDVSLLEKYFNDHPELDLISKEDLTKALDEFFNIKYSADPSTSLVDSLNRHLDEKFDLDKLQEDWKKSQANSSEVISSITVS